MYHTSGWLLYSFQSDIIFWCRLCSGRRSSFHDRAAGARRCSVLQHQWRTRNHFHSGHRPKIRSALTLNHLLWKRRKSFVSNMTSNGKQISHCATGFVVNGQFIGKKTLAPDGNTNTYFGSFGISHQKLGVRLEVSTQDISVLHDGKHVKLLWSDTTSINETKWVTLLSSKWNHHTKYDE